jgi:zinc transport system permease protein
MNQILAMFADPLMQRALIAALLVGLAGPIIGTFLVQRRLALLGDGIGHVALTGVALGWLVGTWFGLVPADTLAVPGAVVVSVLGSVAIELVRQRGKTSGDLALALLFYGGIAAGAVLIKVAGGTNANLMSYLFGSVSTVSRGDVIVTACLAGLIIVVGLVLRGALFAISNDEGFATASGLPTRSLNIILAALAAITVTTAMRVVGVLLVSALMIVPVAIAQLMTRSFSRTMALACGLGVVISAVGVVITYWCDLPPGGMIVVLAVLVYAVTAVLRPVVRRLRRRPSAVAGSPEERPMPERRVGASVAPGARPARNGGAA